MTHKQRIIHTAKDANLVINDAVKLLQAYQRQLNDRIAALARSNAR